MTNFVFPDFYLTIKRTLINYPTEFVTRIRIIKHYM